MTDIEQVLYVEENALIADFPPDMTLDDTVFEEVNERFEKLADRPHVDTHVSILQMDGSLNNDVFERAQEAAEVGKEYGITTWIVVSDGIKKMALKSQVGEIEGVETITVDSKAEAMERASE